MAPIIAKTLNDYFSEEIERRAEPVRRYDAEFPVNYAPAYDMFARRQYISCMDRILRKEQVRHAEKRQEFKNRWEAAAKTLHGIDDTIALVDKPYTDSKYHIERSMAMAGRQSDLLKVRGQEAVSLLREKVYLKDVQQEALERLAKFTPVREYLSKVVDASHAEFKAIKELIDRADLLLGTRKDLLRRNERLQRKLERRENELNSLSIVNENSGILLNNYIADVTDDLTQARELCRRLEADVAHVKNTAHHRTMVLGQLKIGTHNIYSQICDSFGRAPKIKSSDVIGQLEYIKGTLLEINKIRTTLNEMLAKEKAERARVAWMEEKHRRAWGRWQKGIRDVSVLHTRVAENRHRLAFGMEMIETEKKLSMNSITKMVIKYFNPKPHAEHGKEHSSAEN